MNVIIWELEFITVLRDMKKQECFAQVSISDSHCNWVEKTLNFICHELINIRESVDSLE